MEADTEPRGHQHYQLVVGCRRYADWDITPSKLALRLGAAEDRRAVRTFALSEFKSLEKKVCITENSFFWGGGRTTLSNLNPNNLLVLCTYSRCTLGYLVCTVTSAVNFWLTLT